MGADISHGRALDECMEDNWGADGGQSQGTRVGGGQLPPCSPPLAPPISSTSE